MTFKVKDHFFHKAKKENFLARSVYKLEEIDKRFKLIHDADSVLDLGYYPGSWIQYTSKKVGLRGEVLGIDIQEINPALSSLKNVTLLQKDFLQIKNLGDINKIKAFDGVLSDMAPSTTGIKHVDQARSLELVECVFSVLPLFLKPKGYLVVKVFESDSAQKFLRLQKPFFEEVHYLRPKSTRTVSKEFFVIAKGFKS